MSSTSENSAYNILAFVFNGQQAAGDVSKELKLEAESGDHRIIANAVVVVDINGQPHVHQPGHGGRGTGIGLAAGGLLGLIGGPVGLLFWAAAGGVVGGFAGQHMGRAIPQDDLMKLADEMKPNSSAILAMVEDKKSEALINDMKDYTTNVVTLTVGDEASGEIAQAVSAEATPKA
jgi:uncharacterized membrane protein